MASPEETSLKIFARDLVAFTDAELDQYLDEHRLEGRALAIDVEDLENLPESFIQRLTESRASVVELSTPVNLNHVTSRLLDIFSSKNTSPLSQIPSFDRASSVETQPHTPTEVYEKRLEAHNVLVNDGGRPFYSVDLIDEVAKDPFSHWEMLRPWVDKPHNFEPDPVNNPDVDWSVFKVQLADWRNFRRWQAHNRREGRPRYVEVEGPDDLAFNIFVREFRRSSPTYTEAVKKLLAEYGFTRPFQLHEDATQQDKLTIWIEYLGYEYSMHYRFNHLITSMQLEYDKAWKTLVDAKVLKPLETEEYICNIESASRRQIEEGLAAAAVKSAKLAAAAALEWRQKDITNPRGPRSTPEARIRRMAATKLSLDVAKASLKLIKRQNDLVTEFAVATRNYRIAKDEARRHDIRARWILEQAPLIEAELKESKAAKTGLDAVRGTKRPRRDEDHEDNEATHDRSIKKQRRDAGWPSSPSDLQVGDERAVVETVGRPSPGASKPDNRLLRKKSASHVAQSSATSKPLRRSARIAARQELLKTVMTPFGAAKSLPQRIARAPAPPSATGSKSRVPAAKIKQVRGEAVERNMLKAKGTLKGRRGRQPSD
ncbi:putative ankyrin [Diplogelasinospora grovesii]|uniref:Ankyrin n=1 Tax=Diplogelasinospora grovesii TaxID=303347 RepID=A0AAN6N182_9PEZI|nr:putative ankyrin [Diplogelasinospora grovesii]